MEGLMVCCKMGTNHYWHIEDGGQWTEAIANINRLRRMDENLGGTQFAAQINALSETP